MGKRELSKKNDEVDVVRMVGMLPGVVEETMQSESASLW
jgi:hypothetical protein